MKMEEQYVNSIQSFALPKISVNQSLALLKMDNVTLKDKWNVTTTTNAPQTLV